MDQAWLRLGAAEALQVNGWLGLPDKGVLGPVHLLCLQAPSAYAARDSTFPAIAEPAAVQILPEGNYFAPCQGSVSSTGAALGSFTSNTMGLHCLSWLSVSKPLTLVLLLAGDKGMSGQCTKAIFC